jgi:hypothetical protein
MRRSLLQGILVITVAAAAAAACGDEGGPGPTTPTPATPVTETHTNTLTINGAITFAPINVTQAGSANATLKTLSPDATAIVGIALGTWSGTTCSIVLANDIASQGSVVSGVVQDAGVLCARVYDVGKLTAPTTFTLDVTHF